MGELAFKLLEIIGAGRDDTRHLTYLPTANLAEADIGDQYLEDAWQLAALGLSDVLERSLYFDIPRIPWLFVLRQGACT
ncbi:MAG: hypothetical protein AAF678_12575, partial [Pseudomonadota bacterium]